MIAMQESIEQDLRDEEAAILREHDASVREEDEALAAAIADFQNWELDCVVASEDDPVVLCPICKARRLMQSCSSIFCGCGGLRLPRSTDGTCLLFLQEQLAATWGTHRGKGCTADPYFSMRDKFGVNALFAECNICNFFSVVM